MVTSTIPAGLERRTEDYRLITGHAFYVDDVRLPEGRPTALHMAVVRSPYAHAEVKAIRPDEAKALPGVVAVFAGEELVGDMRSMEVIPLPGLKKPERRPLALGRVRYVGDPVAVVLAEDLAAALDARDMVEVDYEALPSVTDPEAALAEGVPLLYEDFGTNAAFQSQSGKGDIAAAFGGQGSQTAFGPRGAATVLTKTTTWCAVIFMLTSITLSIVASRKRGPKSVFTNYPSAPAAPAKSGNPPAPKK